MDATALQDYSPFQLRRLLERLREGLYDPLAVRLLTAEHDCPRCPTAADAVALRRRHGSPSVCLRGLWPGEIPYPGVYPGAGVAAGLCRECH